MLPARRHASSIYAPSNLCRPLREEKMTEHPLSYGFFQRLLTLLKEQGFTAEQLYCIPELQGLTPNGAKPLDAAGIPALLKAVVDLTNDATLVLRLGRRIDLASLGTFGFALMSCADLHQVLNFLRRYYQLASGTGIQIEVIDQPQGKILRMQVALGDPLLNQLITEVTFAQICHLGETLINQIIDEGELHLNYSPPAHREAYQAAFSMPVTFSQQHNQLLIPEALLQTRVTTANPTGRVLFQQQCEEMLRRVNRVENFSATVRRVLIRAGGNFPNLNGVADRLHISGRTLRRRLEDEATNFRAICDEVRNLLACQYLETTELTVADIADLLDYAEAVSFRRAFVRWNGLTPNQYRQGLPGAVNASAPALGAPPP